MKYYFLILLYIIPLACSRVGPSNDSPYEPEVIAVEEMALESSSKGLVSVPISGEAIQQKLIKESFLRFESSNLDETYNTIIEFVKQNNGFILNDKSRKNYNRFSRILTIRIPTQNFQKTIDSISSYVFFFDEKTISSKDVTEEFIDLEARLKAKKSLEKRYLELLSKAKNVKEILEIERELTQIREEIESKQGRLKYLENRVSLSTLKIEFYKLTSDTGVTISYGTKMWKAIKSGFNGLSLFFLGILHIWPFILILILTLFLTRRWYIKKYKK